MIKTTAIVCAVATAATAFSGTAFAQQRGHWDDNRVERRDDRRDARRDDRRDDRREARNQRRHHRDSIRAHRPVPAPTYQARTQQNWQRGYYSSTPNYAYNHGYAPRVQYYRGGYVPQTYRQPHYYVNNWQAHNLYAPPYGHQWVRTDTGDFLLMAIATGIIANLLLNR